MYLVRETFIAKPGHAGELAELMAREMKTMKGFKGRIMLDMVAQYNTIVAEYEIENLAVFERMMNEHRKQVQAQKQKRKKPHPYTEMYQTGKREIFRIIE